MRNLKIKYLILECLCIAITIASIVGAVFIGIDMLSVAKEDVEIMEIPVEKIDDVGYVPVQEKEISKEIILAEESGYSEADIDLIKKVVQAEAGAEPLVGKIAVACTILNRAECRDMSIEDVVFEENQYAVLLYGIITAETSKAVEYAIENRDLYPRNLLYFRTEHYHSFGEPYAVIGHHYFSTDESYEVKGE